MGESGQLSAGRHQIGLFAATLFVAVVAALALANVCLQRRKRWISAAAARSPWPCLRLPPSEAWPLVATVTVAGLATFACVCYAADPVFTGMVVACVALDAASWIAAAAAVALQSARTTIPTCSLPTFWALSLGVKLYALIGVPGYSPPSDTDVSAALDPRPAGYAGFTGSTAHLIAGSRLAGVQWSMVAVEAALVVLGWCCCCAGMGVHVDIVAADDGGATAGGQPRQRVELSSEKRSKSSGTPLLGSPDAVERGRAGLAADESKAAAAGARAPPNPQRTRVNAGLKPAEVESFYDGFGRLQDAEAALYMDHAKRNLRTAASSTLKTANVVVEIGCGTGALAAKLLEQDLSPTCRYIGIDISKTMVDLTTARVARWAGRCTVVKTDGGPLPREILDLSGRVDAVFATYVFDAMKDHLIYDMLEQLHTVLSPTGRLCLCSLTYGGTPFASAMTDAWVAVYKVSAKSMGGCRPVELLPLLRSTGQWEVEHNQVMTQLALSSQVVVAKPLHAHEPADAPHA